MIDKQGKIIAIVGAPRSGKSFLARKLATHYNAQLFLEGEESELPLQIKEDIAKNIRPLQRILWFRAMYIKKYLKALKFRKEGYMVILDAFWITPQMFIDTLLEGFERELMWDIAYQDQKLFGWPDLIIFLKISEKSMRKFITLGSRSFDQSEDFILKQALPVNKIHSEFFVKHHTANVATIERDALDFEKNEDFQLLANKIDSNLKQT
jgi:deoxyadenosine/deoxycytidine kinase